MYSAKIESQGFEDEHTHVEADTLIPNQVMATVAADPWQNVFVWSPHTDVFVLLLHLAPSGSFDSATGLNFLTGRGEKFRRIDALLNWCSY